MNPCDNPTLQSELKAYLDGQLPFVLRQRVRRHLKRCAACREELSAMEQISNELHADGPKPLESSLRDRILNAVSNTTSQAAAEQTRSKLKLSERWRHKPLLIWGGAATALVAWFTLYPLFNGGQAAPASTGGSSAGGAAAPAMPNGAVLISKGGVKAHTPEVGMEPREAAASSPASGMKTKMMAQMQGRRGSLDAYYFQPEATRKKQAGETQDRLSALADEEKVERQVHRGATITVWVDNVEARSDQAAQCVQTAGGFVASNELSTGDDNTKTASLALKVPVTQFEAVLSQVARMGEVKAKNVTGEDLTEKISDQEQAEHVLRQDIGTTQEELTQRLSRSARQERMDTLRELRTRIAQTRARLKLLRKLGALSDITLELNEKPRPAPAPKTGGFLSDMNDTLHGAVQSMMQAARLPILTFIWILAYSPLWLLLILGYRYAVRR